MKYQMHLKQMITAFKWSTHLNRLEYQVLSSLTFQSKKKIENWLKLIKLTRKCWKNSLSSLRFPRASTLLKQSKFLHIRVISAMSMLIGFKAHSLITYTVNAKALNLQALLYWVQLIPLPTASEPTFSCSIYVIYSCVASFMQKKSTRINVISPALWLFCTLYPFYTASKLRHAVHNLILEEFHFAHISQVQIFHFYWSNCLETGLYP